MCFYLSFLQCLRDLIGSMMFLIGIKLLRLCRFDKTVAKFGAVIDGAIKEILLFAVSLKP